MPSSEELAVFGVNSSSRPSLPRIADARILFAPYLPCDAPELRRVYLRLALSYHPDKCKDADQLLATQLFQAIAAAYKELLTTTPTPQRNVQRVKTRVAAAAELGDVAELHCLLEEVPARATELDDLGVSPLMFAAAGGSVEAAEILIAFGADVAAQSLINWSVLLYATLGGHAHMIRWLVERGALVTDHELVLAAYTGNSASLVVLLELYGGSVAELRTDGSQKSLLHLACEGLCFLKSSAEQHAECVELVLAAKVPVDQAEPTRGRTCLQNYVDDVRWHTRGFEASCTHMHALEKLCEFGASATVEDLEGASALSLATEAELQQVRTVLLTYA